MRLSKGFTVTDAMIVISIIALLALVFFDITSADEQCIERWKNTGHEAEYRKHLGCYVKQQDGTWLPDNFMRGRSR
jgi:competence protein ComGC